MKRSAPLRRTGFAPHQKPVPLPVADGGRTAPPTPRKARNARLRAVSAKRAAEKDQRAEVRRVTAERAGGRCQAIGLWPHTCAGPMDTNEVILRSGYPGGHLDPANTNLLCRTAHDYVTTHPAEAVELGLRKWSWQR